MGHLPVCMLVHHVHAVPMKARRGHQLPAIRVTDGYELPYGLWESNLALFEEHSVLESAEQSLQHWR